MLKRTFNAQILAYLISYSIANVVGFAPGAVMDGCFDIFVDIKYHDTSDTETKPHRSWFLMLSLQTGAVSQLHPGQLFVPWMGFEPTTLC